MQRLVNFAASLWILLAMLFLCGCQSETPRNAETHETSATHTNAVPVPAKGGAHSYPKAVYSAYLKAWRVPDSWPSEERITRASVTIARDGRVISARIVGPSGDVWMDKSVREALDKVRVVAPFENGAKENSRTFIINFDSKSTDG